MQVVVGHANPDFDAYASTVAGTKLFPGAKGVFLGSQNANVRAFHNLHEEFLDFVDLKGLDFDSIDRVIMVDTRDPDRLAELSDVAKRPGVEVIAYDHHPPQEGDLATVEDRSAQVGATTSIMVHEIRRRGIELTPLEASVMLLGIHEDTGSLTYPGSTAFDAEAAAWLMDNGADIEVLNQFLSKTLEPGQQVLLAQLAESLEVWDVNGQQVAVGVAQADEYVDSASVLTHYIVEDMGYRVAVAVVSMPGRLQIVARSRLAEIDVGAVMSLLGGGGHPQAASASFRETTIPEALARVRTALETVVRRPLLSADIMTSPVRCVLPEESMRSAGERMAAWGHGGLPVMGDDGRLVGLVTRKDVDKATRHGLAHAPVTGFMARDIVTVGPEADLTTLERLLATRGIGRVPVVADGQLVGIVTRKDVLRAEHGSRYFTRGMPSVHPQATQRFVDNVERMLPTDARAALHQLGSLSDSLGIRAHVVGGFVRDMLLGRPNLDIDVVVEGEGVAFAEAAAELLGARVKVHRRFGTAVIAVSRDFHIDVASARTEYYARPGALPTVERSSLRQDLFRRDFSINAMAACLEPSCFGAIADPFGGLRDLDAGTVRVLHALSFVDDPTRVLRAARFEERYGFRMDPSTEGLAMRAVEMGMLAEVSGARLREELLDILAEQDPVTVVSRLGHLGALDELLPEGAVAGIAPQSLGRVSDAVEALGPLSSRPIDKVSAYVAAMGTSSTAVSAEKWLRRMRIGKAHAEATRQLAEHGERAQRDLQDRRGMRDSRLVRLLDRFVLEATVNLWALGDGVARRRIERFLGELSGVSSSVTGRDLIALGAAPSETFSAILARARDDRLDGRAVGREAELANLRRIAIRAGVIDSRKDSTG